MVTDSAKEVLIDKLLLNDISKEKAVEELSELTKTDASKENTAEKFIGKLLSSEELYNKEAMRRLAKLEGMNKLSGIVKNKEDLRSVILLGHYINSGKLKPLEDLEQVPRDDFDWFKDAREEIAYWDGEDDVSDKFESFISHIQFFQHLYKYFPNMRQLDLDKGLEDTEGRELNNENAIGSLFTLEQLKKLLKEKNFIQEGKMIRISSGDHATALFKNGRMYYCFDPNEGEGEFETDDTDVVAEKIFDANFKISEHLRPSPLGFKIFSFDDPPTLGEQKERKYPPQKSVLKELNVLLGRDDKYSDGYSGLFQAIRMESLESIEYFLENGSYLCPSLMDEDEDEARKNPRIIAMLQNNRSLLFAMEAVDLEIVEEIINNGACIDVRDENGSTPLINAVKNDFFKGVKILLERGADPNIQEQGGETALMLAIRGRQLDIIKELLAHKNINLDLQNEDYDTALMLAAKKGCLGVMKEILKSKNLEPMIHDDLEIAAFILASEKGFLSKDIDIKTYAQIINEIDQNILLLRAAKEGSADKIKNAIKKGAYINVKDEEACTILMHAVDRGDLEMVKILLTNKEIDLDIEDEYGLTVFEVAENYPDIFNELESFKNKKDKVLVDFYVPETPKDKKSPVLAGEGGVVDHHKFGV